MFQDFIYDIGTKVYFGPEMLCYLGEEIKKYGDKVFFLYKGSYTKTMGIYDLVMQAAETYDFEVVEFSKVQPNPRHTDVQEGADLCREKGCKVILAVGGGSAIDSAKAIASAALLDAPVWDIVMGKVPVTESLPLITIPTVAATGSEMNGGAVISNLETRDKQSLRRPSQRPRATFLNPQYTYSVSKYQTACGSVDILCHTIETYFSSDNCMYMLDTFMEGLVRTVLKYAPVACREPDNDEARANLMWAAPWAINDFLRYDKECNWTIHPIEHEISAYYDITHGLGLAIIMPRYLRHIIDEKSLKRFRRLGVHALGIDDRLEDEAIAQETIRRIESFCWDEMELESHFLALGIDGRDFDEIAGKLTEEDGFRYGGYRRLSKEDIVSILKECL